ncbi:MAG TPA: arginine deiminase family protein, partial [Actinotalea sp.]
MHSEVGRLRTVIVHRPDISLERLTSGNHDDLLFDDLPRVEDAQREHDAFVALLRERGVEVLYHQDLLAEALDADPRARLRAV